jgi:hypothetical protein
MKMITRRKDVIVDGPSNLKKMKTGDVEESSCSSSSSSSGLSCSSSFGFKGVNLEDCEHDSILSKIRHRIPELSFEEISRDFKSCASLDNFSHRLFIVGSARKVNLKSPNMAYSTRKYLKFSLVIEGGSVPEFLSKSKAMISGSPENKGYEDSILLVRSIESKTGEEYICVKDRKNEHEVLIEEGDIVLARLVPECSKDYKAWSFGWIRLITKSPESKNSNIDFADNEPGI